MRGRERERERERERKGERKGFYVTALWMHAIHPRTLATNLAGFARFGYLKDLPEILYRFLHDPRDERKDQDDVTAAAPGARKASGKPHCVDGLAATATEAAKARREKEAEHAQAVLARYDSDEAFHNLYDGVANLFVWLLKSGLEHLRAGDTAKIVFAAKCARRTHGSPLRHGCRWVRMEQQA
ncbi:uncharacterized protein LOC119348730 isoform X2 [Triticum dicoccoides]|uniref:uncharacterized protein LOC119348730 isoform X2 n=1 Tax=Triticum dicoccoides TaxID=85692 RepID=UPI00188ECF98|nr:uncharacterized protein LOC119348730 isoform X2 [Triticum dicoccoides]